MFRRLYPRSEREVWSADQPIVRLSVTIVVDCRVVLIGVLQKSGASRLSPVDAIPGSDLKFEVVRHALSPSISTMATGRRRLPCGMVISCPGPFGTVNPAAEHCPELEHGADAARVGGAQSSRHR